MPMTLEALQSKFLAKCEEKCTGAVTLPRMLRKHFQQVDLDNDGAINIREWASIVERLGGAIAPDEATALFEFWDTQGYTREPQGLILCSDAIASLMTAEKTSEAVFDHASAPPSRGNDGNKNNRSSVQGGIFGGGVYESDARRTGAPRAAPADMPFVQAQPASGPKGNQSSIEGGIFGSAPEEPSPRSTKFYSNQSSVPGGIFGNENAPPPAPKYKRNSNASSIPGGIFG